MTLTKISTDNIYGIYKKLFKRYGPQGWWPGRTRFEVITGAILTQNTAWSNVEKAIANLRKAKALTPDTMKKAGERELASLIKSAGYYNIKARRLKNFLEFLYSRYCGSLNRMAQAPTQTLRQELLAVNGIGPETCDSILLYAFNRPIFVIDAYTKRVFSRHHCFPEDATYHEVQKIFEDALPPDTRLYNEYHALIVRLAKHHCRPTPRCHDCPLAAADQGRFQK